MNTDSPPSVAAPYGSAIPPNVPPKNSAAAPDFQPLDPRVVQLWRVRQLITSAVLLGIALVGVAWVGLAVGGWAWLWAGFAALATLRVILFFWYPVRAYRGWGYRLDGKVLETREGIWFRSLTLLPLSRLQHVDLHSGPIQRSFGLASLLLHTAGTQHASIVIPGLDAAEAARLRDQLVAVGGDDAV
jgi:membrane protein YdbS with pleckstrin-like domain